MINEAKLNKNAKSYFEKNNPFFRCDDKARQFIVDSFKQGARWLMQQPLSERLTEDEVKKIRTSYLNCKRLMNYNLERVKSATNEISRICAEANCREWGEKMRLLEVLFGKDLFTKTES